MSIARLSRRFPVFSVTLVTALLAGAAGATSPCGPFLDLSGADAFCPFVLEIFSLGITTGTTPTTYDPAGNVTRLQMAAFLSRTVDRTLQRGGRRAAANRFWTPQNAAVLGLTTVGSTPEIVQFDGSDLWTANFGGDTVSRVRSGDGKLLETWTGAGSAFGVVAAMGRIVVTGDTSPGLLYVIDPTQAAGAVTTVASGLPNFPNGVAFDGARFWTANGAGSVSIVTPGTIPWTVTTVTSGFSFPGFPLYDGANVWVTDFLAGTLLKLGSSGAILQTVTVGTNPQTAVFDGTNLWVPNVGSASVSVVRASSGALLQTLTGNGISTPSLAAFDGERVLITDQISNSLSLWKAADLTPLGNFSTGGGMGPRGACSDGMNFWIAFNGANKLARF